MRVVKGASRRNRTSAAKAAPACSTVAAACVVSTTVAIRPFRRTEDDHTSLIVGAQVEVTNEGDRSQRVWIDGNAKLLRPEGGNLSHNPGRIIVLLGPSEKCEFRIIEERTLKKWTEVWQARQDGDGAPTISRAEVICSDPYDEGVIDRWELQLIGNPVEQIPNDLAGWKIRNGETNPPVVEVAVRQQTRDYYLSKHDDRKLVLPSDKA
jgi:hypothetical protein